nr:putative ribonuclease H-like domain-containing protein [Tanacetum cinerariifolium]
MTGNKPYLTDYQEIDGGFVAFGGNAKGGKITGKGKIKTGKLNFEDVYFVKELKFNLFSVLKMCDKKNSVHFTDTECVVLSPDFKLLDESQVLLKVFFLATKDETPEILKNFITRIENQMDHNVKTIRCDNRTEFKNRIMNEFCEMKVNIACYVQNRMLVIKPYNKTPYELFLGRKPALSFMRPFECPVIILNTLDHLGKFDGKSDDGFFVGYSINSKAFRVFNTRTRFVEENLHITFLENKPNVTGIRPNWMFDIDILTMSMNYQPVFAGNQTNGNAGTKANIDAGQAGKKTVPDPQYVLLPLLTFDSQGPKTSEDEVMMLERKVLKFQRRLEFRIQQKKIFGQREAANTNSLNRLNTVSSSFTTVDPRRERAQRNEFESIFGQDNDANGNRIFTHVSAARSTYVNYGGSIPVNAATLPNADLPTDPLMPDLEDTADTKIFSGAYDNEVEGAEADCNNLELTTVIHISLKVEKALYGLFQAPKAWYETLSTYLLENRFRRGIIDKTLFIKKDKGDILLVQVYVDDIIFGFTKKFLCTEFEGLMHKKFQMSSMRVLTFFLGLQVMERDVGIFISQDKYVADILKKFYFSSVKTASTSIKTNKALLKDEEVEDVDVHLYRLMIGSLMYLTASRPDIMFVVYACARFQVTPKVSHLHVVNRIFRYLKGQPKLGLWYPRDSPFDLKAFSDSNYAGASLDRKSTTEGCQFLKKRRISWLCKKQTVVANSTTEADYVATVNCYRHVSWI